MSTLAGSSSASGPDPIVTAVTNVLGGMLPQPGEEWRWQEDQHKSALGRCSSGVIAGSHQQCMSH